MVTKAFSRPFTQQEPINQEAIDAATQVLKSGRLHRYNTIEDELSEASLLEEEYAAYQGSKYCLSCASGGYAMSVALKAAGLKPGESVLTNTFTLAPVPGSISNGNVLIKALRIIKSVIHVSDTAHIPVPNILVECYGICE